MELKKTNWYLVVLKGLYNLSLSEVLIMFIFLLKNITASFLFMLPLICRSLEFNETSFDEWVDVAKAPALPASLKLYNELQGLGIHIILLTGRSEFQRNATQVNLLFAGYHSWEKLILRYFIEPLNQWVGYGLVLIFDANGLVLIILHRMSPVWIKTVYRWPLLLNDKLDLLLYIFLNWCPVICQQLSMTYPSVVTSRTALQCKDWCMIFMELQSSDSVVMNMLIFFKKFFLS